jgi:DNA-binding Xre family transcriptional regulator
MSTVRLNVSEASQARGVENPFQLSKQAKIGYALAHKLWNAQSSQVSLATMAKLCDVLDCEPGDLLVRERAKSSPAKARARKSSSRK